MDEEPIWEIIEGGPTPWGGRWFTVDVGGVSKTKEGMVDSWWEGTLQDEEVDVEEPEHMYIELDAEQGKTRWRLQSLRDVAHTDKRSADVRAAVKAWQEGKETDLTSDLYFYEGTTDVSRVKRSKDAVHLTLLDAIGKWSKAPYLGGDHQNIPYSARMEPTMEYVRRIFEVDTGFHGLKA